MRKTGRVLLLGVAAVAVLVACDSVLGTNDLQIGFACGPGTANDSGTCVPAAVADPRAPSFGGAVALSPVTPTTLRVDWAPGASALTTADELRYSVYVATAPGSETFASPNATVVGATTYTIKGLSTGTEYYVVVRSSDNQGHQELNTIELHARAQADTIPPTFAGIVSAVPAMSGGKTTVSWAPADDDLSGPSALSYLIYAAEADPVASATPLATVTAATSHDVIVPKPLTPYRFMVRAMDAAGNVDQNTKQVVAISGPDAIGPDFGGCTTATAPQTNLLHVTWSPGHDEVTPDALLWYDLYAFTTPGPHEQLKAAAATASFQGTTGGDIPGVAAGTTYYVTCRARDLSGNSGGNPVEVIAATPPDTTAPDFAGLVNAAPVAPPSYEIVLHWQAGSDLQTSAAKLRYAVFTSSTAGGQNYALPPAATVTGQTSTTTLARPGETTYFVVRALDEAGNLSPAIKELPVTPLISYDWQIQPIWTASCINQCHTLFQRAYNPILAAPVSYTYMVSDGTLIPGHPEKSAVYLETICNIPGAYPGGCAAVPPSNSMPAGAQAMPPAEAPHPVPNAKQVKLLYDWIMEGAPGPLSGLGAPPGY